MQKGKHIEYDFILAMTEKEAKNRPSIPVILSKWLKLWEKQINDEDLNLNSNNTVSE